MQRTHVLLCIAAAEKSGFVHYAGALRHLFEREFGCAAPRAIRPPRSLFFNVSGADFRRSIDWASSQPPGPLSNAGIREHVAAHHARKAVPAPCSQ